MLPRKWKIFRAVSYLHLTIIVLLAMVICFGFSKSDDLSASSTEDIIGVILTSFITTVLIINCIINLVLLDKNYPATLPGRTNRIMSRILFILTLLALIVLVVLSAAAISSIFDRMHDSKEANRNWPLDIFFGAILLTCLSGIYIAWNQVSLRKALRRNHRLSMENFLEQEEPTQP